MKKRRAHLSRTLSRVLEVPCGVFGGLSCLTLNSNCEMTIEGCKRVEEYESGLVRLELCDQRVTVVGRGLSLRSFFGGRMKVYGHISEVKLQ